MKGLEAFAREAFPPARKVSLQSLTTWRIGGDAMCLDIGSAQAASDAIGRLDAEGIDWFVLGRGSNILAADGGYAGMLLAPGAGLAGVAWSLEDGMHRALAGCAARLPSLAGSACTRGAGGLLFAAGIPGSVGGAVCMNAGAYGSSISEVLSDVEAVGPGGSVSRLSAGDCRFGYRSSAFQGGGCLVTSARFRLPPGEAQALRREAADILRRRRSSFPLDLPSAGSVFRRAEGFDPPGMLIEKAGLKGTRVGGARVSEVHANFFVNDGGATSSDMASLIRIVRDGVERRFGVRLEEEIVYLGFDGGGTDDKAHR